MAQLKDLLVSGPSRLIGKLFANEVQLTTLNIPTASNGTTYGAGTSGQVLTTNGTSTYWGSLSSTQIPPLDADQIATGVLPVARGGTGLSSITSGQVMIGNGTGNVTTRAILNNTSVGALGWNSAGNTNADNLRLIDVNTLAYWNGAYSGTSSNLKVLGTVTTGTWNATTIGTAYGGTGNMSFTANRLIYTESTTKLSSAASLYATTSSIGINTTTAPSENLYVNGNANFNIGTNDNTSHKRFKITGNSRYLSLGASGFQAYNSDDTVAKLYIQYNGGAIDVGQSSTASTITGTLYGTYDFKTTNGFTYSGIGAGSDNSERYVWFSYNGAPGRPVYDADFKYNPATNSLHIAHANGKSGEFRVTYSGVVDMWMGVGSGNENHGLYDAVNNKWMISSDVSGNVTVNGNSATATAANITTTTNAVAYYTNTTGTFGSKASANGVLYATSANGALQWGTLPIAQGGTGATTAANARTNLGLGSMAVETATNYLKWQTTTAASTALYDFGVYVNQNHAEGTGMTGGNYFQIINIPYRKASGNTKADWGFQIGNTTANDSRLWYRTSGDNVWGDWQTIAHATQSTSDIGSTTQPVYMTSAGVITAGTALKDLAYIAKPSSNTTAVFLRGDGNWSNEISGGILKVTAQNNTFSIGSQNTNFNHLYNSANIPFIFNNSVLTTTGNLGNSSYPFNNLYIGKAGAKGIYYVGTKSTNQMITFVDNTSDANGNGIKIGGGGVTVVGAGESAANLSVTGGSEVLYLLSDGAINIEAGGDTIANRVGVQVTTAGHLLPVKAEAANDLVQNIGSITQRWKEIHGNVLMLSGPASDPSSSAGARIRFSYDNSSDHTTQPVYISYTPNDAYRAPAGLKVFGGTSATPAWFETEGSYYATGTSTGQSYYINSSNVQYGRLYIDTKGVATTTTTYTNPNDSSQTKTGYTGGVVGKAILILGNNKTAGSNGSSYSSPGSAGTADNAQGYLRVYGSGTTYGELSGYGNYIYPTNGIAFPENKVALNFRPGSSSYYSHFSHQTSGNEALVMATQNAVTSFIFVNGESLSNIASDRWTKLTGASGAGNAPGLQIKNNCVSIGKLIPNNTTPTYKLEVAGGIACFDNGLEVKGHIAGDGSGTTGHGLYSGGGYHNGYNNIILHGDNSTGTSGIAFVSNKVTETAGVITNINAPSDRAFIQYHACGITTATAEGTAPTLATSGEVGRLVIGIGNDATDQVWLQTPGRTGLIHQVAAASYVIPDTGNTTGNVGSSSQPVYVNGGVITAITGAIANNTTGSSASCTGNAATATKLETARTLTVGSTDKTFDGSANVSWSHAEIGATVSNTWTDGTTAGPTIKTTVNGVTGTAVAIPSASASTSGVVTTGAQTFAGNKTFNNNIYLVSPDGTNYPQISFRNSTGADLYGSLYSNGGQTSLTLGGSATSGKITIYSSNGHYVHLVYSGSSDGKQVMLSGYNGNQYLTHVDSTSKVGNTDQPVYVAANGRITAITGSIANSTTGNAATATKLSTDGASGQYWAMLNSSAQGWKTTTVSNTWTAGTTAGPTIKTTVNGVAGTAVAIPSAASNASGIITTGAQTIAGAKTLTGTLTIKGLKATSGTDYGETLPSTGAEGQVFFQLSNEQYELPTGGTSGQALVKTGNGDRQVGWADVNAKLTPSSAKFYVSGSQVATQNIQDSIFNTNVYVENDVLQGAAWNDYAEYRETTEVIEPGRVVIENGDDTLSLSTKRMQPGAEIVSDTFGFAIGQTEIAQTPIATTGRVLAYPDKDRTTFKIGQPVCSGPNGTVSQMTNEEAAQYPWLIIGTVSAIPQYTKWNNVKVNNRIWIRVR